MELIYVVRPIRASVAVYEGASRAIALATGGVYTDWASPGRS